MRVPIDRRPNSVSCRPTIICRTAWLLTMIGSTACAFMPGETIAQQPKSQKPSQNAADYYRRAAAAIKQLTESEKALVESTGQLEILALYALPSSWSTKKLVSFSDTVPVNDTAADTAARLEPSLRLFHQGAQLRNCDWQFDFRSGNLGTTVPRLGIVAELVPCVVFQARYRWAVGLKDEAIKDLLALKTFAGHVGAAGDGGLISLVVQFNVERVVMYMISQWMVDPESTWALKQAAREPSRPPVNLAKKALLLEKETLLPLAKRLIDTSHLTAEQRRERHKMDLLEDVMTIGEAVARYSEERLLAQIEQAHGHYHDAAQLLDLPVDEFQSQFDRHTSEVDKTGNMFSGMGVVQCPGIERVYYDVREMRVRWRMLQAAIDIRQSGSEALPKHNDPFGDGPFEYECPGDGFVLTSRLIVNGTPVRMRFNARHAVTPVVSRLHTLSIHVRSHAVHDSVYALLNEVLQLPPTYDPVTYGERKYAAVQAGNLCLEPCGPYPDSSYLSTNFEGMFYGLTFEPHESASASARELDRRGILHRAPTQSVRVNDKDLSAPNIAVGIGEKESRQERSARAAGLAAKRGGPIGLSHVEEIQIGYSDEANLRKWTNFILPAEREGEDVYRIGDGPALRFVQSDSKQVLGITIKVRSLSRATSYLKQHGLLGRVGQDEVEFDRVRTHGLRIVLRE